MSSNRFKSLKKSVKKSVKKSATKKLKNKYILFSGFRSDALEHKINILKGVVVTSFSKRVYMVVTKNASVSSEKTIKAKQNHIPVVTMEKFCNMFGIVLPVKKSLKKSLKKSK